MPNSITTMTGTSVIPTQFTSQRNGGRTKKNGVMWLALFNNSLDAITFWFSVDNGVNWSELTGRRLTNGIKESAGLDFKVILNPNGEERIAVTYVKDNRVRTSFGKFSSNRQSFTWANEDRTVSSENSSILYPQFQAAYALGNDYHIHFAWSQRSGTKNTLHYSRIRFYGTNSSSRVDPRIIHSFDSATTFRASWGFRHAGDDDKVNASQPDAYLGWYRNNGTGGTTRTFQMRFRYTGSGWREETRRYSHEDKGVHNGLIASCVNGKRFITVMVPHDTTDMIMFHVMSFGDTLPIEDVELPDLMMGEIQNLDVTWDAYNGDLWILASGATNGRPHYIKFDWATQTFGAWTEINTDVLQIQSLSAFPSSRRNRIDCTYSVVSGANSLVKHQLVGVTNFAPSKAIIHTKSGAYDRNSPLVFSWSHVDIDGDPQVAYAIRRTNAAGTGHEYWNGATWQSTYISITASTQQVTFASGWQADLETRDYQVETYDGQLWSDWGPAVSITGSIPVNPTITSPTGSQTVVNPKVPVAWTVSEQLAYRWEILNASSVILYDGGWKQDSIVRSLDGVVEEEGKFVFDTGVEYKLRLTTQNNEGLASTPVVRTFNTNFTPPSIPLLDVGTDNENRRFILTISNSNPGGLVPDTIGNEVYVQLNDSGIWTRVATDIPFNGTYYYYPKHDEPTDFFVRAYTADGAYADSNQTAPILPYETPTLTIVATVSVVDVLNTSKLLWVPPGYPSYTGFDTVTVTNPATTFLGPYNNPTIVDFQVALTERCSIVANNHLVVIGFESFVNTTLSGPGDTRRAALTLRDEGAPVAGAIMHLEGAKIHGFYSQGDVFIDAPQHIIQMQNILWRQGQWARGRSGSQHPDCFQPYGGAKKIRLHKCTSYITYQSTILGKDPGQPADALTGEVILSCWNIEAQSCPVTPTIELCDPTLGPADKVDAVPNWILHMTRLFNTANAEGPASLDRVTFRSVRTELNDAANTAGRAVPLDGFAINVGTDANGTYVEYTTTSRWLAGSKLYERAPFTSGGVDWATLNAAPGIKAIHPGGVYTSPGYV